MLWGFRNGLAESVRLAKQFAEANGMAGLNCVDAQPYDQPYVFFCFGCLHPVAVFECY